MKQKYPLKRMCDVGITLLDCVHKTPKPAKTGYPYIAIPEIRDGRLDLTNVRLISEADYLEWTKKTTPQAGDIVVTRRARVGDSAVIPPNLSCAIGQNLVILRSDNTQVLQTYLRWVLRSPQYWAEVEKYLNQGSIFDSLNCREIPLFEIPVPTLEIQKKVSSILSSLDDKIELNTRMNKVLEEIAQALFKHWFVDFEFPNEEGKPYRSSGGKMVESEMGLIPEGWEIRILGDIVDTHGGYSYKGDELQPSKNALATIKNFNRNGGLRIDGFKEIIPLKNVKPAHYLSLYDVLVAHTDLTQAADVLGNCELLLTKLDYEEIIYSMDLVKVTPKIPELNNFVLAQILSDKRFKNHALGYRNGTTVLHLSKKAVPDYELPVPNNLVLFEKLGDLLRPLYIQMSGNIVMNRRLVELRDTLLPKLMKGELSVMNHKTKRESFEA